MLERFKNHCNNPITWGAYYKLCGIGIVASAAVTAAWVIKWTMDLKTNGFRRGRVLVRTLFFYHAYFSTPIMEDYTI